MKGIELNKIEKEYKFTIDQSEKIKETKDWMLTKYKNVRADESVEMVKGKPQLIITLTSK